MASDSDTKLTKFTTAVTVVTAEFANSIYYKETTVSDTDGDGTTVVYGHVHDGTRADGHAAKVHLTAGAHVRGKLGHNNLADDSVNRDNVMTFQQQDIDLAIPVFEGTGSSKKYFLNLGAYEPPGSDKNILFKKVTGSVESVGAEDNLSWDYTNNRLGINTPTPGTELHIVGNSSMDASLYMERADSEIVTGEALGIITIAGGEVDAGSASGGTPGGGISIGAYASETFTSIAAGSHLAIGTTPIGATARTEKMRIKADGNVGINVTNPGYKLDVGGTGNFSDSIWVGGDATIAQSAYIGANCTIGGNLTVNGTTTHLNVETTTTEDPVILLGNNTPSSPHSSFRGLEFQYYDGSVKNGFLGMTSNAPESPFYLTFLKGANNSSESFSGTLGGATLGALSLGYDSPILGWTNQLAENVVPNISFTDGTTNVKLHISNSSSLISTTMPDISEANMLVFQKSRGTLVGGSGSAVSLYPKRGASSADTIVAVNKGDVLGGIAFKAADGADTWLDAAAITAYADDAGGPDIAPGRLGFATKGNTAGAPTLERLRINTDGDIGIGLAESPVSDPDHVNPKRRLDIFNPGPSNLSPIRVRDFPKGSGHILVWDGAGVMRSPTDAEDGSVALQGDIWYTPIEVLAEEVKAEYVVPASLVVNGQDYSNDMAFVLNPPVDFEPQDATVFSIHQWVGNNLKKFIIKDGNFGIGTNDPVQAVHVYTDNSNSDAAFVIENAGLGSSAINFRQGAGSNNFTIGITKDGTQSFAISRGANLTASNRILDVTYAGNVGIGVVSPTTKLDVNGVANATTLSIAGTQITATAEQINAVAVSVGGQVEANKAVVTDANKDVDGIRNTLLDGDIQFKTNIKGLKDGSGNYLQKYQKVDSAVNHFVVKNAATGNNPTILVEGSDTNIGMTLTPKGTGRITLDGMQWPAADGTNNQVLKTDGSGNLSWTTQTGGGGGVSLSNDADNRLVTADGNNGLTGEAGLTYNGSTLLAQDSSVMLQSNSTNNFDHSVLTFAKSGNATDGGHTVVQNNEDLGAIEFQASDGTDYGVSALIKVAAEGTPSNNNTPGRLTFHTTSADMDAAAERMRIDSSGNIGIGGCNDPQSSLQTHNGDITIRMNPGDSNVPKALYFKTGRGSGVNNKTAVNDTDNLGYITWMGADGSNDIVAASINARVSGNPNTNNMPGDICFATNAGASATTERLVLTSDGNLELLLAGEMRWYDANSSNYVGFKSPATVAANKMWTLPATDGTSGQVLKTDGSGVLSWVTAGGGSLSNVVEDTTPQLGGDLDVNGNSIVSTSNANITIAPNGSGDTVLSNGNLGIGTTNPLHRIHMVGETSNSVQLRMEEHGNFADGPDIRFYTSRGTESSPTVSQTDDFIGGMNARYWDGSSYEECGYLGWQVGANASQGESIFSIKTNADGTNAVRFAIDTDGNIGLKGNNELRFYEGANYVGFEAPALTGNTIWVLPDDDGTSGQVLKTDGSGNLSWVAQSGGGLSNVVDDTSPQLGGDLDVNGNSIVSTSNAHITIAPNGSGDVYIQADATRLGDQNSDATLTTNGTGDLILSTNQGINSGTVKIFDGANGNILLEPNGSGKVGIGDGVSPNTLLHIKGTTPGVTIQRSNNNQDSSILFAGASGYIGAEIKHVNTDNDLAISVLDGNGSVTERITVSDDTVTVTGTLSVGGSNNELRFYEGANYVGFEAPALAADKIWVLPAADGTNGQVLKTDGSGNLGWVTAGGGGINDVVQDTTPQLGGNLDVNSNKIVSTNNGDINLSPNGSGRARVDGTVKIAADDNNFTEISTTNNGTTDIIPTGGSVSVQGNLTAQRKVIVVTNSNVTLTPGDSGALVVFDSTAGRTVTLPDIPSSNDMGTWFEFFIADDPQEGVHKVIVDDTANTRFKGSLIMFKPATDSIVQTPGGSDIAMVFNGTTSGKIDTNVRVTCIAPDKWMADPSSIVMYSGNVLTPFSQS